MVFMCAIFNKK